jgi:hypothetical protein
MIYKFHAKKQFKKATIGYIYTCYKYHTIWQSLLNFDVTLAIKLYFRLYAITTLTTM